RQEHFRQVHFLCEHEACLAKKFVVFQSEVEMKRHNTIEHSGLSRSKRNAALQIPVSFRYRGSAEEHQQRGRRRGFHLDPSQLTIQGSSEMAAADGSLHESSSVSGRIHSDIGETNQSDMITSTMESLAVSSHPEELSSMSDANNTQSFGSAPAVEEISFPPLSNFVPPEPTSRYAQALNQGISARLVEASFPPLPGAKDSIKPMIAPVAEGLAANTIAARLKLHSKVVHSARPKASQDHEHGYPISGSSLEMRPQTRSQSPVTSNSNFITGITANQVFPPVSSASPQVPILRGNGFATSIPISSVWNSHSLNRARLSASAPNPSISCPPNNPPSSIISSVNLNGELSSSNESLQHVQNVQIANKSLVESIRSGLGMDEEKYAAFKIISTEYRQDRIDSWEYLSYVEQFGLSHLVLDLARLCPDSKKQQELIDAYNANVCHIGVLENNSGRTAGTHKVEKRRKGKGKAVETAPKDSLADNNLDNGRELQTSDHSFKEMEVLSKDGYYTAKVQLSSTREHNTTGSMIVDDSSSQRKTITDNSGGEFGRRNRKLKFHILPLDEGNADGNPRRISGEHSTDDSNRVPVLGVWHNGGGHRLVSQSYASK
ncbi:uncharacterized protein LOC110035451, partial [Phalaenopsis equestris]|uniref:uncharacterized protein LOC110035451 n=1 Tax=Phalaenopsis equestris TaxID=78828 RepID=UPI0009E3D545